MSKISLQPNASGTGTFTIAAPNSNTDRTLTLPDAAGEVLTNTSDIEAQVKTATNATGTAPIFACRAWVNFNGTNASIRGSGNVSSITRHDTGQYTVNFTTAMPDANYSITSMAGNGTSGSSSITPIFGANASINTGSFRFNVVFTNSNVNNPLDALFVLMSVFR